MCYHSLSVTTLFRYLLLKIPALLRGSGLRLFCGKGLLVTSFVTTENQSTLTLSLEHNAR